MPNVIARLGTAFKAATSIVWNGWSGMSREAYCFFMTTGMGMAFGVLLALAIGSLWTYLVGVALMMVNVVGCMKYDDREFWRRMKVETKIKKY